MNPTYARFESQIDHRIDTAQEICLSVLLGIFSVLIFAASLALGIAGAMIIIGFTALKVSIQYTAYIIGILRKMQMDKASPVQEESIILPYRRPVYRRPAAPRQRVRRKPRTSMVVQRYQLYTPFAG